MANTVQSGINEYSKDMTQYSLFLGGLNVKNKALEQYSPYKTGYSRIFFVKMPQFMKSVWASKTKNFKHLLEYGFVGVDGIQNTTLEFEQVTGGYTGRGFDVASTSKDETTEITVKAYELAGSPIREYTEMWISGISDPLTGIAHYHGALGTVPYSQSNHTAEAIYVQTDPTGRSNSIEYACLLSNMMPKTVKKDHLNYEAGQHNIVQVDIPFSCVKYESPQINSMAKLLIDKFQILNNFVELDSGYTAKDVNALTVPVINDWKK